jgi:hypothetical protein
MGRVLLRGRRQVEAIQLVQNDSPDEQPLSRSPHCPGTAVMGVRSIRSSRLKRPCIRGARRRRTIENCTRGKLKKIGILRCVSKRQSRAKAALNQEVKLVFHVFGALAEFERDLIRERKAEGCDNLGCLRFSLAPETPSVAADYPP